MSSRRVLTGAWALAGVIAVAACGSTNSVGGRAGGNTTTSGTAAAPTPTSTVGGGTPSTVPGGSTIPSTGPTSGWGPGLWNGWGPGGMMGGPGMMGGWGSWAPGMMGPGMMGNWWLTGDGQPVQTLDQARQRATVFAGRLGLHVGEIMQFTQNFYAELQTADGKPATEILIDPADGAVQLEYGPAMMWNTSYGMRYGAQSQTQISAAQAQQLAQQWLRNSGSGLTVGDPEPFPGYYTMHTMQSGKIVGMLSVNATSGQIWDHTWHGTYIATSQP